MGTRAGRAPKSNGRPRAEGVAEDPVKVAIVGGGCAGLAAAWQLSQQQGYEVSVYEKSWRLGGKGASGRDADGRIHEHGLHIWLGFYENAFRMMRECYTVVKKHGWGPDAAQGEKLAHGSFEEAFFPEPHIGVTIPDSTEDYARDPGKKWVVWSGLLPPTKGMPGDDLDEETNPFTLPNYLLRCVELLKTLMHSVIGPADEPLPGKPRPKERSTLDEAIELNFAFDPSRSPDVLVEMIARYLRTGVLTTAAGLLQAVTILETWLRKMNFSPQVADTALQLLEAVAAQTRKQLRDLVAVDQKLRWKTEIIDIVMTIAVGLYRDRVLFEEKGLDAINHIDYKDWLLQHGATKTSVESAFITGIYDLTFAYREGDRKQPALAAGVALRGALRMFFTYRGSMFWRMRSGMGDAVFAPLYKVLQERKVKFHLLHALSNAEFKFDKGDRYITRLTFQTKGDAEALGEVSKKALDHFGCWPEDDQLLRSAVAVKASDTKVLEAGEHFDAVILAMGIDDFVAVCNQSPSFQCMPAEWTELSKHVQTVATQAAQVWLSDDLDQLGWRRGSGIITAFEPPFETWADMTHTLATEKAWRVAKDHPRIASDKARSAAYFCAVLANQEVQAIRDKSKDEQAVKDKLTEKVTLDLAELLERRIRPLWPAAFRKGATAAHKKIGTAHVQANYLGSDRYTLSLPGTIEHRVSPLDPTVLNMSIAGDWTASGLDAACVEAAVMSGMLAAFAITNDQPALESIVGYDHP